MNDLPSGHTRALTLWQRHSVATGIAIRVTATIGVVIWWRLTPR
ncbi:hypothetical protein [Salinisphaera japonica]|nr:hypothetical protein [Salinisphaera japonica]